MPLLASRLARRLLLDMLAVALRELRRPKRPKATMSQERRATLASPAVLGVREKVWPPSRLTPNIVAGQADP